MFFGNFEIAVFLKTAKAVLIYRGGKIDTAAFFEMPLVDAAVQAQPHDDKFFGTFGRREFLKTARVSRGINPVADTETPVRRFAEKATAKVLAGQADLGILVCGTGIGISIAANRHKGIRAAILYDDYVAKVAREHNNANVLCFGGRTMTTEDVLRRIGIFLKAAYEGGRHDRRLCKLDLD